MLVEFIIFYSIIAVIFLILAYLIYPRPNSELFSGIAMVIFGILAFASTVSESLEPFFNATSGAYEIRSYLHVDYSLMGINFMFCAIALLFFFMDIFEKYMKPKKQTGD